MREIDAETASAYLIASGRVPAGLAVRVHELGGGVSNVVLRIEVEGRPPVVLKQSRERLRTKMEWLSRLDRIWTEAEALRLIGTILPPGVVPRIEFEDRPNFLFAMTCAPDDAETWKARLLAGACDPGVASAAGEALGLIHARTVGHPALGGRLADTSLFDQLRIDPYYRAVAHAHPDLAPRIDDLIDSMAGVARTLVLGDFSPKNILVHREGLTLVDFETAHAGDPAFDLGFLLSHLLLKAFRAGPTGGERVLDLARAFWESYGQAAGRAGSDPLAGRAQRAGGHAAACLLARIDGKSPVDYLGDLDPVALRRFAREALKSAGPVGWNDLVALSAR